MASPLSCITISAFLLYTSKSEKPCVLRPLCFRLRREVTEEFLTVSIVRYRCGRARAGVV